MKKIRKTIILLVCAYIVLNITACAKGNTEEDSTPIALAILVGNHANSQQMDAQLETTIHEVYSSFGGIGIVVVDGNPTLLRDDSAAGILGSYSADYLDKSKDIFSKNNPMWQRDYLAPQTKKIVESLSVCTADDPEVDLLQALHIAVESLNTINSSVEEDMKKQIIVIDTGISTSGSVNFLEPEYRELLSSNNKIWEDSTMKDKVSNIIDQLNKRAEIPDLNGVSLSWYGLGQVALPQQDLSRLAIQNLQYIWGEILSEAKASSSDNENADERYGIFIPTSAYGAIESNQYVTPVQWDIVDDVEAAEESEKAMEVEEPESEKIEFPEKKIYFCANSDELLPSMEVENILEPYISGLQNHPEEKIMLVGMTSSWNGGSISLSEKRAKKIKDIMIEYEIPENCIDTIGIGYDLSLCQNDSPDGDFEEVIAKDNRSVLILPYDSPKAEMVLLQNEKNK